MRSGILAVTACAALALAGACRTGERRLADLSSANVLVRNTAIERLGADRVRAAVPRLRELTAASEPRATRLLSIAALGSIGDTNAVDTVLPLLAEPDTATAIAAIESLGKLRDPRAVPALLDRLADTNVQLAAIWSLGNIRDPRAIAALTPLLSAQDRILAYNAGQALKKIGNGR